MNTKILASLMVIALVAGVGTAGTFAVFSDTETSSDNTFTAGTLNLKVGSSDPATYSFDFDKVAPGNSRTAETTIKNTGNIRGDTLEVDWTVTDSEPTDDTEPEDAAETDNEHDISTQTEVAIYWDIDEDGTAEDATTQVQDKIGDDTGTSLLLSELAGETVTFDGLDASEQEPIKMDMTLVGGTGNEYQGDMSTVDLTFDLEQ